MRSAAEIRAQVLHLRDVNHLPMTYIADTSRCSTFEVWQALKLDASETTLRKLDAFLDATHLHVVKKESQILYRIEQLNREMFKRFKARNLHPLTVQDMSFNQQRRLLNAMDSRAKQLLQAEVLEKHSVKMIFPDAYTYWQCAAKVRRRYGTVRAQN